ncbi:unnamed protein product [Staurois parvus]|uniref:Uncharacterized protein n=1 Tax=Staurois parvus TaxID=386267 RepID=A0ABN9F3U7_9NEOB|nr:unnamed protein product [Staurois parvus]
MSSCRLGSGRSIVENKPWAVMSSCRLGLGRSAVENKPRVNNKIWMTAEKARSKILAGEHNNLANRKFRDMAYIRKFMGGARGSRFMINKVKAGSSK